MKIDMRKLFSALVVMLGGVIHAAAAIETNLERLSEPMGEFYKPAYGVAASQSRITLYRPSQGYVAGVISVQLNGNYHTSLQLGSFAELCLPATSRAFLSARMQRTGESIKNYTDITTVSLKPGQDTFVRVVDMGNSRTLFTVVEAGAALAELQQTRRQMHALSRVDAAQLCEPEVATKPVPTVTQVEAITLGADALFDFGKADAAGIGSQGRAELDRLIALVQKHYGGVDKTYIEVVGYADPLGNPVSNQRLSAARANAIANYMVAGGIPSSKISSEGRGDSHLIVTDCVRQITPQSIACNKPNRRVVVAVLRRSN